MNLQKLGKIVSKKRFETKHEGISYSCQQCEDKVAQRGNVKEHKESHHEDHFILVITVEMNHGGKLVSKLTRGQCTKKRLLLM